MKCGKLISIEGTEGAGKSTAMTFIQDYLMKAGIDAIWTREPGGTPLAEEIRNVLLHPASVEIMMPETELLLMFAARAQHIKTVVLPALNEGKWVISDRFIDATYAYQGGGRQMDEEHINMLDDWIVDGCYPDLTLLLDLTPELGFARAEKRGTKQDRIEQEKMDFFKRVREKYLSRAADDPKRIKIIDAALPPSGVETQMKAALDGIIK